MDTLDTNQMKYNWVRGHAGYEPNEIANSIAKTVELPIRQIHSLTPKYKCPHHLAYKYTSTCLENSNLDGLEAEIGNLKTTMNLI